jgi:flagellar basal-body rod protein FlgB
MKQALDVEAARHSVIAHNIANVNTPGYKAKRLAEPGESRNRFSGHLSQAELRAAGRLALASPPPEFSDPRHIPFDSTSPAGAQEQYEITQDASDAARADGNNVNIHLEMGSLAESEMRYLALAQMVSGRLITLRKVINEGRTGI